MRTSRWSQICIASLHPNRHQTSVSRFNVFALFHCHFYSQAACVESGLMDVLHKLWAWCTVDQTLLTAVLSLLCTLTARASKGERTLAWGENVLHDDRFWWHYLLKIIFQPRDHLLAMRFSHQWRHQSKMAGDNFTKLCLSIFCFEQKTWNGYQIAKLVERILNIKIDHIALFFLAS